MPIREALAFIKEHGKGIPPEVIREQLRKKGYVEDDIEEALQIVATENLSNKGSTVVTPKSTLWEAVTERVAKPVKETKILTPEIHTDWNLVVQNIGFWIGVLFPSAFHYFSITFFAFLELFYALFLSRALQVSVAILVSAALYVILRATTPNFIRGLPFGIALLMVWYFINFLLR